MSQIIDSVITDTNTKSLLLSTPLPQQTRSYAPVSHKQVIETSLEALDKAGIKVISELYTSAREGRQASGIYHLEGGDKEMNLRLQWQNSYDKSLPLVAAFGSHVVVCSNGLIIGDMGKFKRKHSGTVLTEFQESITTYVNNAGELFKRMAHDRDRMKEITITKRTSAELIGRMFLEDKIITATQIGIISKELDNPSYNYGVENTLWNTYNAATVAFKEEHPQFKIKRHSDLHNFVVKNFEKEFA